MTRMAKCSKRRRGFTMIELMIVIGLIALLMSFSVVALRGAISTAKFSATKTTIKKVYTQLQQRFESERFQSRKQAILTTQIARQQIKTLDPFFPSTGPRVEAFARKEFVRRNFPQSFAELCSQAGDPADAIFGKPGAPNVDDDGNSFVDYISPGVIDIAELGSSHALNDDLPIAALVRRQLVQANGGDPTKHNPVTESAVLLHILSTTDTLGTRASEQADFSGPEIADTDGDGLLEVIDGWGKPLRFYRWPTRLFYPDASVALPNIILSDNLAPYIPPDFVSTHGSMLIDDLPKTPPAESEFYKDRDDPNDWLPIGWNTVQRTRFQEIYHTQRSFCELLIVSAGADGDTGLYEPYERSGAGLYGYLAQPKTATANLTTRAITDNVSNLKR